MRIALVRSITAATFYGSLFVLLAIMSPATTFHLGPAVVSVSGPIAAGRGHGPGPGLAGLGVALLAVWLLHRVDSLMGPSLLPVGGALLESVVVALAGALLASILRWRPAQSPGTEQAKS